MWVSRKKYERLLSTSAALLETVERLKNSTVLIDIQRNGRVNTFTFTRGDKVYEIQTMGLIGDDLPGWKRDLVR